MSAALSACAVLESVLPLAAHQQSVWMALNQAQVEA